MTNQLLVWDKSGPPPSNFGDVLHWNSYSQGASAQSIPRYLEEHAGEFRAKYLAFIHDLGESTVNGRCVVEHLKRNGDVSFWWMSQLVEKNPFKSPRIYDCLRALALEELLIRRKPRDLYLESANRILAETVETLCRNLGISFHWRRRTLEAFRWDIRLLFRRIPHWLQGGISLIRYVLLRLPLCKMDKPQWFHGENAIFICSYFFNLDSELCAEGRFHSMQWGQLPSYLRKARRPANWIHHFQTNSGAANAVTAASWVRRFNCSAPTREIHGLIDGYISIGVIGRVLKKWVWLLGVNWKLRGIKSAFYPKKSSTWLWPLLRYDWLTSVSGQVAINNCFWVEMFDIIFREMPRQELGLYLWENQGWEVAMLHAWRKHGHGELIGVPHATVCFWHLNNFEDRRGWMSGIRFCKPMPDRLAINGPMAWKAFVDAGYPTASLVKVEALRFQYLRDFALANRSNGCLANHTALLENHGRCIRVLVLGDSNFGQSINMLMCLQGVVDLLGQRLVITLKAHPACRVEKRDCSSVTFDLVDGALGKIMQNYDFAFASNSTSAGVDAYLAGLPTAVFLDETTFNNSPLRGFAGVHFVSNAKELANALLKAPPAGLEIKGVDSVFWLDDDLLLWRRVLEGANVGAEKES